MDPFRNSTPASSRPCCTDQGIGFGLQEYWVYMNFGFGLRVHRYVSALRDYGVVGATAGRSKPCA